MNAKTKSVLIVLGSVLVGVIIGVLAASAIMTSRVGAIQALRMEGGFVHFLERVIEPVDEAQREEIREVLQATARHQMELRQTIFDENRRYFENMRVELDRILNDEQKARLREWSQFQRRDGPGFRPPDFVPGGGRRGLRPPRFRRTAPGDSLDGRRPVTPRDGEAPADSVL